MPGPADLDARAAALRSLAAEVDGCADRTVARASSPGWSSPNADAALAAQQERDRREQARREQERLEQQRREQAMRSQAR